MTTLVVILAALAAAFLLLRFNALWIYRVWDRATRNDREYLPPEYELPRYFRTDAQGNVDFAARWPGWDGWYFFVLPDDRALPLRMARASLMTGLYGLEGIDNYDRLLLRLSTFDAAECLSLIPTAITTPAGIEKRNNLSQHYLPRRWHVLLHRDKLDVAITGQEIARDEEFEQYGRITGAWPRYRFEFLNPEAEIRLEAAFKAERIVWWADIPGVFTYFAVFGRYDGTITYLRGTRKDDPHHITGAPESYPLRGRGCFEHGFARKLFAADRLFLPVRLLNQALPAFRPIRYHYELFLGETGPQGGFMHARAFGIPVRNRGGLYANGRYDPIESVEIEYLRDPAPDIVAAHCPPRPPVTFYRKWRVRARTRAGVLEYTGTRDWPPAAIATNMMYYQFEYEGSYAGQAIRGRGYGEYVHV